jgi:DHA2 family multidrug resistance protein
MKQDYQRMLSDVAAQQAKVELDQATFDRSAGLLPTGSTSKANYDQAHFTLETDKSKLESLRQQAAVQLARLDGKPDLPVTQHPQYLQAKAQVDEAQRLRPSLFRDRNFTAGVLFVAIVGLTYYASLALQPPYLQNLMNYPIVSAGMVMGPRGVGTMAAMLVVGKLMGPVDTRLLLGVGLGLTAWSFYAMTGWTPDVSQTTIIVVGVIQGIGLGFLFVPLSVVTLSTLSSEQRAEGAGLYSLSRNIGSSIGISVVNSLLTQNTQVNHAAIAQHVTAVNRVFEDPMITRFWNPLTAAGRAALDAVVTRQAQIIAYIDDYKLLMIATIVVIPLLVVFKPWSGGGGDHAPIMD